jgi:hypothetical protein
MSYSSNIAFVSYVTARMPVPNRHVQGPGHHHHPAPPRAR